MTVGAETARKLNGKSLRDNNVDNRAEQINFRLTVREGGFHLFYYASHEVCIILYISTLCMYVINIVTLWSPRNIQ